MAANAEQLCPLISFSTKSASQLDSRLQVVGATATVSTFATVDGQPNRPTLAGISRGLPCFPSKDSINAVSLPQIYAPAPR